MGEDLGRDLLEDEPEFVFARIPEIDWRDIRLLLARSFLLTGQLGAAAQQIVEVGGKVPDPIDETSAEALLRELERLFALYVSAVVSGGGIG